MAIDTVIFDLGRVLVRIDAGGVKFGKLMRSMGIDPSEAFAGFWRLPEVLAHMTGAIDSREFHRLARERFRLDCSFEEFAEGWCDLFEPNPGMEDIFLAAAERRNVGLLSDTDPLHWNHILAQCRWLAKVPRPTLSYNVGFLKPSPEMYAAAARDCGRRAEECVFVDDAPANVEGARKAGMTALLFTGPEKLLEDLEELHILDGLR